MADDALKQRLKGWQPPTIDPKRKPRGLMARRFPQAVRDARKGVFRPKARQ